MEKQYKFGLVIAAVVNFLYGGIFLPITFAKKRAEESRRHPTSPDKKERRKQREAIRRENRRCIKYITFYIDIFFKTLFLVFVILTYYLSKTATDFYDGIVTKKMHWNRRDLQLLLGHLQVSAIGPSDLDDLHWHPIGLHPGS